MIKADEVMTPAYWAAACAHLSKKDRVMKRLIPQLAMRAWSRVVMHLSRSREASWGNKYLSKLRNRFGINLPH